MAFAIARRFQREQGWDDETLLDICLDYIYNQDSAGAFTDHLNRKVEEEAELCQPSEVKADG